MRFVDLDKATVPDGWQTRADQALDGLREEINKAEATALAAGADVRAARRSAISAGLKVPARKKIWQDMNDSLAKLTNGKCWYSESRNPTADKNVDHFRPKSRVAGDDAHEGYWWLAFSLRNYRYSSQWCNQRRVDDIHGTEGGKWDNFPLRPGSFRARQEQDDCELELPDLLDPIDPDDWKLLTFRKDGYPVPVKFPGTPDHHRAENSIELYHLNCKELVTERRLVADNVQRIVQDLERLHPSIGDPKMRALFKSREKDLLRAIHPDADYSAAALAYAHSEIYKLQFGHQVKREWLQEILN